MLNNRYHRCYDRFFSFYFLYHLTFPFGPRDFFLIPSDFYLHWSVLSCWLRSSTYSLTSLIFFLVLWWHVLWVKAGITWSVWNTLFLYIPSYSCTFSLTLTYLITHKYTKVLAPCSQISLSLCRTIESTLLRNLRTYGICLNTWNP